MTSMPAGHGIQPGEGKGGLGGVPLQAGHGCRVAGHPLRVKNFSRSTVLSDHQCSFGGFVGRILPQLHLLQGDFSAQRGLS